MMKGVRVMRKENGFSIMELLITMIIIGILAAIAIPSYTTFVQQGAAKTVSVRPIHLEKILI